MTSSQLIWRGDGLV